MAHIYWDTDEHSQTPHAMKPVKFLRPIPLEWRYLREHAVFVSNVLLTSKANSNTRALQAAARDIEAVRALSSCRLRVGQEAGDCLN
jgi:hypothetical protein